MNVNKEQLTEHFRSMTNEELLERANSGTLTEVALEVVRSELAVRGMTFPKQIDSATTEHSAGEIAAELQEDAELLTIAQFNNPLKASLARSCLESEGIFVHLLGEHLGIANVVFSAATGGMRLQVRADQAARAKGLLAAIERGDYELDDDSQVDEN